MIEVNYHGRLGNNIFQYFIGRIISDKLNFDLICPNDYEFMPSIRKGNSFSNNPESHGFHGHHIGIENIIKNNSPRKIIVDGFFQRTEYFNKEYVKRILNIDRYLFRKPENNSISLNIRSGDLYKVWKQGNEDVHPHQNPCPYSYYSNILNQYPEKKKYIICERIDDPVLLKLKDNYDIGVVSQSPIEDFYFIYHSEIIVLSVSTIAWWSAWLSEATKIYYPVLGYFDQKIRSDINLIVNESRYEYIQLNTLDWKSTNEQIKQILWT